MTLTQIRIGVGLGPEDVEHVGPQVLVVVSQLGVLPLQIIRIL